jgi:hypothetical protein
VSYRSPLCDIRSFIRRYANGFFNNLFHCEGVSSCKANSGGFHTNRSDDERDEKPARIRHEQQNLYTQGAGNRSIICSQPTLVRAHQRPRDPEPISKDRRPTPVGGANACEGPGTKTSSQRENTRGAINICRVDYRHLIRVLH